MKTRIIIDSTTDIAENLKNQVITVPLTVSFGKDEYIDGVTIDNTRFYEMLLESDILPTTSQATPEAFRKTFDEVKKNNEQTVVITLSSCLSGTYQSACIAASDDSDIFIVDSKSVSIGAGILADLALQLADNGMSAKDIADHITKQRENIRLIAMLDTLEYLKKGGRISKAAALAGTLLNLKPVICLEDGIIKVLGKARGSKQGNNLLMQEIEKAGGVDYKKPILLGYTGLTDILVNKYMRDSSTLWAEHTSSLPTALIGSVVGTHAGPGAIAVAFFNNEH